MATVTLIQNPPFTVNLQPIQEPTKPWQIQDVARQALEKGRSVVTLSFKQIVIDYYKGCRIPAQLHIVAWKVVTWMATLVWCALTTAGRLFWQKIYPVDKELLNLCLQNGIDIKHLRTDELIDMSDVPDTVKVDNLIEIFDQINLTEPGSPGYVSTFWDKELLRENLTTFINRVNGKIAFEGTPSIYDTSRLIAFYQQIENGIRASIHKVNQDIQNLQEDDKYDHNVLLKRKNQIVVDLATSVKKKTGDHYMRTALWCYRKAWDKQGSHKGSLEQSLIEILAWHRFDVAKRCEISKIGKIVAVPGMENIAEHPTERNDLFMPFFYSYNIDSIKKTIQNEFCHSKVFRKKIQDWLFMHAGDWGKEDARAADLFKECTNILASKTDHISISDFVTFLGNQKYSLPQFNGDWQTFVNELFGLTATNKTDWANVGWGEEFLKNLLSGPPPTIHNDDVLEMLMQKGRDREKADQLCSLLDCKLEKAFQIVKGEITPQQAVDDFLNRERRNAFLDECGIRRQFDTISDEIMQGLLVSHKILLPLKIGDLT